MGQLYKCILIVDDEEALRKMLAILFEEKDFQVQSAANGEEAWNILKGGTFDVLFTDMFMPNMSGIELIEKCQKEFKEMKMVLFSGGGRGIEADDGGKQVSFGDKTLDVDLFIKKPFRLEQTIESINSFFD